ncbi:glycoprotein [Potato yellow dwarf virus]|uniref:Glycoprotein n=1 Tax=Potato yellow dwarf virus TaxID=195060 RepID=D5L204_9RHAB|nr:glycoprotein [Potato yellow dwarf virus]ADE45273.1 glycoprotein [Potato yellow dwarf virus]
MFSLLNVTVFLACLTAIFAEFIPNTGTQGTVVNPPDGTTPPSAPTLPTPPPPRYDPGLAAYKETHSDTMYDVNPVYQCNQTGIGYSVSEWYGICKDQCSSSTKRSIWNISLFDYQNFVASIPVFATTILSVTKTSHVSFFGTCLAYVSDERAIDMNYTDFISHIPRLLNSTSLRPGDTSIVDDTSSADCSYWSDNTRVGNIFTMDTDVWSLTITITGDLLIKNPYSLSYTPYNESAVFFNGKWFFWDSRDTHSAPECALSPAGDDSCSLNANLGILSCERSGIIINLNGLRSLDNTCVGSVNISSNNVPFRISSSLQHDPVRSKLYDLMSSTSPSYTGITALLETIGDTIDTLESTYCSALCDLSDRSFQTIVDDEDVVDTPNGPWLPVQDQEIIRLVPCGADINWLIYIPLTVCVGSNLVKISRLGSSDAHWWDPQKTYYDPQESCDHESVNNYDSLTRRRQNISIVFWRGTAVLSYPYTGPIIWIPRGNPNSIRSSKWFPQIKNISDKASLTMSTLSATITQSIGRSINTSRDDSYIDYSTNQISFLAGKIWTDICIAASSVWNFATGTLKYGTAIIMALVATYIGGTLFRILTAPRRSSSWADM